MHHVLSVLLFFFSLGFLNAQMSTDGEIRYGNEWMVPGETYLRIDVAEDGIYQVSAADLAAVGLGGGDAGATLTLYHQGERLPLYPAASGNFLFYGKKNRGELDRFLFTDAGQQQLNPRYSMHTDTAAYYLAISADPAPPRFASDSEKAGSGTIDQITRTTEVVFGDKQSKFFRRSSGNSVYFSHYEIAEGYGSRSSNDLLSSNGSTTAALEVDLPAALPGTATLDLRYGLAFDPHQQEIRINGNLVDTRTTNSWAVMDGTYDFTPSGNSATLEMKGTAGDRDKANLAYVRVTYPAAPEIADGSLAFSLPAGTGGALSFTGIAQPGNALLFDLTSALFYRGRESGAATVFELPERTGPSNYVLYTGSGATVAPLHTVSLPDLLPDPNDNYLVVTSRRLAGAGLDELLAYRASPTGGDYGVHSVYIEDLYEQFGYGIRRHPLALRNYLAAAGERASGLRYLFLVGKGREYRDLRNPEQLTQAEETFFIPSFGYPASDNLLSAPLDGVIPALSTGRLAAITPAEVALYVKKLKEVERQTEIGGQTIEDRDWMKQILHLAGGQAAGEQASIQRHLGDMELILERSTFGTNTFSFYRTSTDPIETSRQEDIFNRINNGVSMITFFGHSGSQRFDFNIDNPAKYDNRGKYPFMMSLGCYSGDAFTEERSISERFIFLEDKGAIAFVASKGLGYISALGQYGRTLYAAAGGTHYGMGVGDIIKATIVEYANTPNFTLGILNEQFSLSGDPAYRMHPRPGPDLIVDPASVSFSPATVPAQEQDFTISLRLLNLGIKDSLTTDSTRLNFRQQLPNGEIRELANVMVRVPTYDEDLSVLLPNLGFEAVGQNRILVTVDSDNALDEQPSAAAEANNELKISGQLGVPLTVVANTAKVAFPPRFATAGPGVELIANTSNPLAPERKYVIEIAERTNFASPLIRETISAPGGIIRYTPALPSTDSTTYYWRISPDSSATEGQGFLWSESSFTYLKGSTADNIGWAQQEAGQLATGEFTNISANSLAEGWDYRKNVNDVEIYNGIYQDREMPRLAWNGARFNSPHPWFIRVGIQVMVIDTINNFDWLRAPGGLYNTPNRAGTPWSFDTRTEAGREGLLQFLDEGIPSGKYVIVWSVQRGNDLEYHSASDWAADSTRLGRTIYGVLEDEGALQARLLAELGSVPYTFAYIKGVGPIAESIATSQEGQIATLIPIEENWQEGTFKPLRIGPALEWSDMEVTFAPDNISTTDSSYFRLYGEDAAGNRTLLQEGHQDVRVDLTFAYDLSAYNEYPYLVAEFDLSDADARSVPTVKSVYVDYRGVGDVAINPQLAYSVADSVARGEPTSLEVGYQNISRTDMDSLLVSLQLINKSNEVTTLTQRQPPVPAGGTGIVNFDLDTELRTGDLRLQLALNPLEDQPEEVTFNNFLLKDLAIGQDEVDPDMQVYFDGRRIRNGELVSSQPVILVQLRDDNKFLRLTDTSAYEFELTTPTGDRELITFADERIEFIPADPAGENLAEVYFRPTLTMDGKYSLAVLSEDRSGNASGRIEFRQDFEVLNEQLVSNVLAYPNPFTTQTQFVYTLTGSTTPQTFRIQIMTVSGRVVRDIDLLAHETVKIGTHRTDFTWDGTDEYGDPLANGVYLYRVITRNADGEQLEKYDTNTAQYFKNEIGKVVILR